ncbi:MAG: lysostaphin resistance A-like protein [Pirellulaceae bacterium]
MESTHPGDDELFLTDTPADRAPLQVSEESARPVPPQPGLPASIGLALLTLVGQTLLAIGAVTIMLQVDTFVDAQELDAFVGQLWFAASTLATLLISLVIGGLMHGRQLARRLGFRSLAPAQGIALLVFVPALGIVVAEVTNIAAEVLHLWLPEWMGHLAEQQGRTLKTLARHPLVLMLLAGCVFPGLGEEILCRGIMSRGLLARYGTVMGTLWTALVFGAMHVEPVQSLGACLLGIGLQYAYLRTRSIVAPVAAHIANNTFALLLLRYQDRFSIPGLSTLPGQHTSHTPLPLFLLGAVGLGISVYWLHVTRTLWRLPDGREWTPVWPSAESPPAASGAFATNATCSVRAWLGALIWWGALLACSVWFAGS